MRIINNYKILYYKIKYIQIRTVKDGEYFFNSMDLD
jgi:hypothetical protein